METLLSYPVPSYPSTEVSLFAPDPIITDLESDPLPPIMSGVSVSGGSNLGGAKIFFLMIFLMLRPYLFC